MKVEVDYGLTVEPIARQNHGGRQLPWGVTPRAAVNSVVDRVAADYGVTRDCIFGNSRKKDVCHARHEVMWALREMGFSYPRIARVLGRDHTTIIHGCRQHEERMAARQSYD